MRERRSSRRVMLTVEVNIYSALHSQIVVDEAIQENPAHDAIQENPAYSDKHELHHTMTNLLPQITTILLVYT